LIGVRQYRATAVIPFWKVLEDASKRIMGSKGITLSMQSKQCEKFIKFLSESGPVYHNYDVQNPKIEDEEVKGEVMEGKIIYTDFKFSMLCFKEYRTVVLNLILCRLVEIYHLYRQPTTFTSKAEG